VALFALLLGLVLAPKASKGFNEFKYQYLTKNRKIQDTENIFRQINDNDIIYVSRFDTQNKVGFNFTLEHFNGNVLEYKIFADNIRYMEEDSTFRLIRYVKRKVGDSNDIIEITRRKDTVFDFDLDDLSPVTYMAETLGYRELNQFIEKEKLRGSSNIGRYEVVKYKKWSLPVSVFILTIIAVSVSSIKRRGGMGINLAFGIAIAMVFVFFDKIFGVMAEQSNFPPLIAVWFPNVLFGLLAAYLLRNAKR
jgi:lipopolysaccharide export system permease protein